MNELIEKFAEQCTTSCIDGRGVELNEIDVAKFAELIVRECAAIASAHHLYGALTPEIALKNHFNLKWKSH